MASRPSRPRADTPVDPLPVLEAFATATIGKSNSTKLAFANHMQEVMARVIIDLEDEHGPGRPGMRPGR